MPEEKPPSIHARAERRVGTTLKEKWTLDRLLGVGGMAAVYAATHRNGKRAAVKILHTELSMEGEVLTRFLREGYAANKVDHPGAVSVLDDDVSEDGAVFLVMELLEGESLGMRADRQGGTLDPREVFQLTDALLDVMVAAHAQGVVHRDLKPDNVFLVEDGGVKVLDFGIARLRETADSKVTQTGLAMGTPSFMPPEQARGRWSDVDVRSDVWAIGATMYALLVGRPVHTADTMNEVLLAAMTLPARPIGERLPELPASAQQAVDRALAYERDARWPDAASMQTAVRAGLAELREGAAFPPSRPLPPRASPSAPTVVAPARTAGLTTARAVTDVGLSPPREARSGGRALFVVLLLVATSAGGAWWLLGKPSLTELRGQVGHFTGEPELDPSASASAPGASASAASSATPDASGSTSAVPSGSARVAPPRADPDDVPPGARANAHKPTAPPASKGKGKGKGKH